MELIDSILLYREKKEDFIKKYIDKYQVITLRSNVVGINKCLKESYILLSYFDRLIEQYSLKKFVFDNADGPFVIYLCYKDDIYRIEVLDNYKQDILSTIKDSTYKIGAVGHDFLHYSILNKNGLII